MDAQASPSNRYWKIFQQPANLINILSTYGLTMRRWNLLCISILLFSAFTPLTNAISTNNDQQVMDTTAEYWPTERVVILVKTNHMNISERLILQQMDRIEKILFNQTQDVDLGILSLSTIIKEGNRSQVSIISGVVETLGLADKYDAPVIDEKALYNIPDQEAVDQFINPMYENHGIPTSILEVLSKDTDGDGIMDVAQIIITTNQKQEVIKIFNAEMDRISGEGSWVDLGLEMSIADPSDVESYFGIGRTGYLLVSAGLNFNRDVDSWGMMLESYILGRKLDSIEGVQTFGISSLMQVFGGIDLKESEKSEMQKLMNSTDVEWHKDLIELLMAADEAGASLWDLCRIYPDAQVGDPPLTNIVVDIFLNTMTDDFLHLMVSSDRKYNLIFVHLPLWENSQLTSTINDYANQSNLGSSVSQYQLSVSQYQDTTGLGKVVKSYKISGFSVILAISAISFVALIRRCD